MDKEPTEPESSQVAQWVIEVIQSCNNAQQMELCEKLVNLYQSKFPRAYIFAIDYAFKAHAIKTNYYIYKEEKQKADHSVFISESKPTPAP